VRGREGEGRGTCLAFWGTIQYQYRITKQIFGSLARVGAQSMQISKKKEKGGEERKGRREEESLRAPLISFAALMLSLVSLMSCRRT